MEPSEKILAFILGSLLILFFYFKYRLSYLRYLKTYKKEITNFLEKQNYTYLDSRIPNGDEWKKNPFSQDSGYSIKFWGLMFSYSETNFTLITATSNELITEFWMAVKTTPFRKPVINFRQGTSFENTDSYINKDIKIVQVNDSCPACGFKLTNQETECPDCGLNFN